MATDHDNQQCSFCFSINVCSFFLAAPRWASFCWWFGLQTKMTLTWKLLDLFLGKVYNIICWLNFLQILKRLHRENFKVVAAKLAVIAEDQALQIAPEKYLKVGIVIASLFPLLDASIFLCQLCCFLCRFSGIVKAFQASWSFLGIFWIFMNTMAFVLLFVASF